MVPLFAGHTYILTFDNGAVFHNAYSADGTELHWQATAGPLSGQSGTVALNVAEVGSETYFVSWIEADTETTVSHVMDLSAWTVHAFWTYPVDNGRTGELHAGTFELAPDDG